MEYLNELWHNQPNTFIGVSLAILVMLGIYIKLLDIYIYIYISEIFLIFRPVSTHKQYVHYLHL